MKIELKPNTSVEFNKLGVGDVFEFHGRFYMTIKREDYSIRYNAINLDDCALVEFKDFEVIRPHNDAKIVIG